VHAVSGNYTTHAQRRCALQERLGHSTIGSGDGLASASNGQDTVMDTLDNLANTSFDASFIAQIGDVLATFANDDAGLLGRHNGSQSQLGLGVFLVRLGL
jgi:hypothetical protein